MFKSASLPAIDSMKEKTKNQVKIDKVKLSVL